MKTSRILNLWSNNTQYVLTRNDLGKVGIYIEKTDVVGSKYLESAFIPTEITLQFLDIMTERSLNGITSDIIESNQ